MSNQWYVSICLGRNYKWNHKPPPHHHPTTPSAPPHTSGPTHLQHLSDNIVLIYHRASFHLDHTHIISDCAHSHPFLIHKSSFVMQGLGRWTQGGGRNWNQMVAERRRRQVRKPWSRSDTRLGRRRMSYCHIAGIRRCFRGGAIVWRWLFPAAWLAPLLGGTWRWEHLWCSGGWGGREGRPLLGNGHLIQRYLLPL